MFSKSCEYTIRAIIYIAKKKADGSKASYREIANEIDAPEQFIAKVLQLLCQKGFITSFKGPTGGFYISKASKKTTLAQIVKAIDGDQIFKGCSLGLKTCSESKPCPLHEQFKPIRKEIHDVLKSYTIDQFNLDLSKGLMHLKRL